MISCETAEFVPRASIERLPWFNALAPGEVAVHARDAMPFTIRRYRAIIEEGQAAGHVCVLIDGMAMVEKVNAARVRQVLGFLFPGDMFGLAHGVRYTHGVTGLIDGHGLAFARGAFDDLCERSPAMQRAVFQEASNELAAAQDHLVLLGRKSASERLASFLLSMLEQSPLGDGQRHVWLPMRRSDIANYLGLTLETLSRLFADFMAHGVISRQSVRHIAIRDRAALERVAGSA